MFKKSIVSLIAFFLLISPVSNTLANSSESQKIIDKRDFEASLDIDYKQSIDVRGEIYEIYKNEQTDGTVKYEAHSPEGDVEKFILKENVLYDEKGEVLATINEELVPAEDENDSSTSLNSNGDIGVMAYYDSETSPYPSADYSKYKDTYLGNLQLEKNIKNFTAGALAVIIGLVAPIVGAAMSAILIAEAWENDINAFAIFYKKVEWHHKSLGMLAKQFFVTMYWDPNRKSQAGPTKVYYSTFA
ncbi:hypothetical protein [Cytobacillus solani]|uniref:Uncharacterized protein n=1 Tax=Cytobacillus solani TaxID=1637975 RepID=A0A0Q3VFS1_9BACI|nr:hypothetical protein [Cytobacillus solani]KQL17695.1 hypothetical protein AN957_03095 [Cytobacillus solani]